MQWAVAEKSKKWLLCWEIAWQDTEIYLHQNLLGVGEGNCTWYNGKHLRFLMQGNVFYIFSIKKLFQSAPTCGMTLLMVLKWEKKPYSILGTLQIAVCLWWKCIFFEKKLVEKLIKRFLYL